MWLASFYTTKVNNRKPGEDKIEAKTYIYTKICIRHPKIILFLIYKLNLNSTGQTVCPLCLWKSFEKATLKITTNIA